MSKQKHSVQELKRLPGWMPRRCDLVSASNAEGGVLCFRGISESKADCNPTDITLASVKPSKKLPSIKMEEGTHVVNQPQMNNCTNAFILSLHRWEGVWKNDSKYNINNVRFMVEEGSPQPGYFHPPPPTHHLNTRGFWPKSRTIFFHPNQPWFTKRSLNPTLWIFSAGGEMCTGIVCSNMCKQCKNCKKKTKKFGHNGNTIFHQSCNFMTNTDGVVEQEKRWSFLSILKSHYYITNYKFQYFWGITISVSLIFFFFTTIFL